jgi:division protein CdvB (Snf7/Vps24/ESCRT-III family)
MTNKLLLEFVEKRITQLVKISNDLQMVHNDRYVDSNIKDILNDANLAILESLDSLDGAVMAITDDLFMNK